MTIYRGCWGFTFDNDTEIGIATPWFCFYAGYGAKIPTAFAYYWGVRIAWGRAVPDDRYFPPLYRHNREIVFRFYDAARAIVLGGLPL